MMTAERMRRYEALFRPDLRDLEPVALRLMRDGVRVNDVRIDGPYSDAKAWYVHVGFGRPKRLVKVGYDVYLKALATDSLARLLEAAVAGTLRALHRQPDVATTCAVCRVSITVSAMNRRRRESNVCSMRCKAKLGAFAIARRSKDYARYEEWWSTRLSLNAPQRRGDR